MSELSEVWPPELDAVSAAPEHHRLVMENDQVRVLETIIQPGETTALHTHQWPASTYFLSWSECIRRDAEGKVLMDSRESMNKPRTGQAAWTPILGPHTLENIGDRAIHVIAVEIKPR
jgi:hypothetical protein